MSANGPEGSEDGRIEQNVKRTVGQRALKEIRGILDEEQRREEANAHFLRAFVRYGWIIMLLVSLVLAKLLGVF